MFSRIRALCLLLVCVLMTGTALAQVTTGNLSGTVTIAGEGTALPGVTVEAVHVPTGTRYMAVTNEIGRFVIPNVRVGSPYRVTATLEGFQTAAVSDAEVRLGATAEVPLSLRLATVSETINVVADFDPVINPTRTGSASTVSEAQIENLPTVNRSLQDFARTNPYTNIDPQDASATRMTIAGKNNRYNNIQIDGAVNNDLFGLADTGTPGGQADAPAISLDAIQELQVLVSPYDVRQSGFTGGGVNAITRSGSNDIEGSIFYSERNDDFVGDGPSDEPITDFGTEQFGGRIGGPIIQDRLFFFLNGEVNEREEPTGVSALEGTTTLSPAIAALARDAAAVAQNRYGHDVGTLGEFPQAKASDNYFARLDWNVNDSNQFTLRHNYVEASRDVVSDRFFTRFRFETSTYQFFDETNSTVAQLNSVINANMFNEARLNFTTIRDERASRAAFPAVEIGGAPRNAQVILGSEQFSQANSLDQDILEFTDDLTFIRGAHTLTVGTSNQVFDFANLFLAPAFGYYFFPTLADFEAGTPRNYEVTFATDPNNPRQPTSFGAAQYGLYVNDLWQVTPDLNLTLGLRADMPQYEDTPNFNALVQDEIGFSTAQTGSESVILSPRLGFNWKIGDSSQLRGGAGIFLGRSPYVWISNIYANTGVQQQTLVCNQPSCTTTFVADPFNQPRNFPAGSGAYRVNLIDDGFELPRILRATLGYDFALPWDIRATTEVVHSMNQEDVYFTDVNAVQTGTSPLDGRPTYSRDSTRLTQAIMLTNTGKGDQTMASLQLNKTFGRSLTLATAYTWQDANSAFDGTSSQAHSNFQFHHTQGDIFTPKESTSAFETEHRFNLGATYDLVTGILTHSFGLFYNAQSGRPYSLLFGNDINTDGFSTNDLLYIPDEVIITKHASSTWTGDPGQQWINFLEAAGLEAGAGRTLNRYESQEPWTRKLDFSYEIGLPVVRDLRTSVGFDILNLLNLFDEDQGVVRYVPNQNFSPVRFTGIDSATGRPIYAENFANSLQEERQLSTADLSSRWQASVRLRVSF